MYSAKDIRIKILNMSYGGSTAHLGCALSIVEILCVLYRNHLKLKGKKPTDTSRNYLVLSKGHGAMALYACLEELGWLKAAQLKDYFKNGTILKGLSDVHVPGVEATAGTLGHGLSVAVGMALAAKRNNTDQKYFVIVGDGEINEGSIWEAILFSAHHKLDNLCIIVDENHYQAMGTTEDVLNLGNIQAKFEAFNFECESIDGHDEDSINNTLLTLMPRTNGKPKAIVANTVKGKGISFMENDNTWHYKRLDKDTYRLALSELSI